MRNKANDVIGFWAQPSGQIPVAGRGAWETVLDVAAKAGFDHTDEHPGCLTLCVLNLRTPSPSIRKLIRIPGASLWIDRLD